MHINIYGPQGTGKTRYAEEFKKHYACDTIVDNEVSQVRTPCGSAVMQLPVKGRALIISHDPVDAGRAVLIQHVPIYTALRAIGKTGRA